MPKYAIDLFAGVGGLSLGFEMSGFDVILAIEYDASIAEAYEYNHPNTNVLVADITTLPIEKTFSYFKDKTTVIFGGPPCQGFSQKGQRLKAKDERNFLFHYFVSVVEYVRPQYFVMENVPNLLTTERSYFKKEIENLFEPQGYKMTFGVLNAADYGVPQNRRRAVIIGKHNTDLPLNLPTPSCQKVTIWDAISDLAYLNSGEGMAESDYFLPPTSDYQKKLRTDSERLFNHVSTKHTPIALERLRMIPPNCGREVLPSEHRTKSIYSGTWTRMVEEEVSVTITTRFDTPSSGKFTHPFLDRAITVREAARLQSFPDRFRFIGTKSSQMKQVGNAVPPLLAYAIAKTIMEDILQEDK